MALFRGMEELEISESRRTMDWGRRLPAPIGKVIFSKLVISNLPACRLVCKNWNKIVLDYSSSSKLQFLTNAFLLCTSDVVPNCQLTIQSNPKMHCINLDTRKYLDVDFDLELEWIKSSSLQFDGEWSFIPIANQCNGLLFIIKCAFYARCDGIFNPMTNEFIQIPRNDLDRDIFIYGFGFSLTTKQYKLFRTFASDESLLSSDEPDTIEECRTIMEVLTFGGCETNLEWTPIHYLPFDIICKSVYLNGAIYWLGKEEDMDNEYSIYVLDVETEMIESNVNLEVGPYSKEGTLLQFNTTIYATFFIDPPTSCKTIQVWKMLEKDSWIKEFVINDIPNDWKSVQLVKAFEDGEILCMINMDFFCFYNPVSGRKKIIPNNQKKFRHICPIESLNFGLLPNILMGKRDKLRSLL